MRYNLTCITDSIEEPVTKSDLLTHVRVTEEDDEKILLLYAKAARRHLEKTCGISMMLSTWSLYLDYFPSFIEIPRLPLNSLSSIKYRDTSSTWSTYVGVALGDNSKVQIIDSDNYCEIRPAYGTSWPSPTPIPECVWITYVAGYGSSQNDVPADLRLAVLMLASHYFENREASSQLDLRPLPFGVESLISPYNCQRGM